MIKIMDKKISPCLDKGLQTIQPGILLTWNYMYDIKNN